MRYEKLEQALNSAANSLVPERGDRARMCRDVSDITGVKLGEEQFRSALNKNEMTEGTRKHRLNDRHLLAMTLASNSRAIPGVFADAVGCRLVEPRRLAVPIAAREIKLLSEEASEYLNKIERVVGSSTAALGALSCDERESLIHMLDSLAAITVGLREKLEA